MIRKSWMTVSLEERLKYQVAEELGLMPKVLSGGWPALSANETGRIGGLVRARKKREKE